MLIGTTQWAAPLVSSTSCLPALPSAALLPLPTLGYLELAINLFGCYLKWYLICHLVMTLLDNLVINDGVKMEWCNPVNRLVDRTLLEYPERLYASQHSGWMALLAAPICLSSWHYTMVLLMVWFLEFDACSFCLVMSLVSFHYCWLAALLGPYEEGSHVCNLTWYRWHGVAAM